jgi:ADP-heptose:LPS heptosyltransferase
MSGKDFLLSIYLLVRFPFLLAARVLFSLRLNGTSSGRIARILLIRPDRLGDFVVSLPVVRNIKDAYPGGDIDVMVSPALVGLARKTGLFSDVLELGGFWRGVSIVRRKRYDIVIDLVFDYTVRTALLALAGGAARTIGFARGGRGILFSSAAPGSGYAGKTMCDIVSSLLDLIPAPRVHRIPEFPLQGARRPEALTIGIHPGGHFPSQRWLAAKFAGLASLCIRELNARVVIIGGERDRFSVEEIRTALNDPGVETVYPVT